MRCVDRAFVAGLILLTTGVAGCATPLPPASAGGAGSSARAPRESAPQVSPAVRREFADALRAMKLGRYREAEAALLPLTHASPELSGPYANLGIVYFRLGKLPEAAGALKKAIAINPGQAAYYNQLGIVYRQSGQFDDARGAYAKALQIDPDYPNAHLNLGILYDMYLEDFDQALQHYERYQDLQPSADAQVTKWIVDLKNRHQLAAKTAKRNSE